MTHELLDVSGVVYGVHVHGRLPATFRTYLVPCEDVPADSPDALDVSYRLGEALPEVDEVWASEIAGPGGPSRFGLFRLPGGFGLTVACEGRGLFRCTPRTIEVEWSAEGTGAPHYFVSYALPLWLETRRVPVLHGSAVVFGGRGVGFVGPSGSGKSLLCAELIRLGCGFLADDGLAVRRGPAGEWRCFHGSPLLRLWPSGLEGRLAIASRTLPKVHEIVEKRQLALDGSTAGPAAGGVPLAAIYLLGRRPEAGGAVTISECGPREALVRLIENSVAAEPAAALGLSAGRLELLADLTEKTPARFLGYPSGDDSATRIRDAIVRDLEKVA